ncbi:MFS transporter [Altererythrobacter lutimaris]|uniref:MFS transporter n=1 Tax=Altererythrobacter lutimaris TaxID=2743979 RepID=A0A850HBP1_9SPHN|nr:MFS transporter [Altererythrobacter lutimaris]NVE93988.1 MFS transporter [Altererythrobacter lutimaris]
MSDLKHLTRAQEYALAITTAVVIANAYYLHPIIGEVARDFGVSQASIGIVPALNQIGLALGILLLLPLGDRYSNRSLSIVFVTLQTLAMLAMTLSYSFWPFTIASTLLGFFTITPYILPAFASKRVAPERLGEVTALLTAGTVFGILVARVGAGVVAEYFGWHAVYWIATSAMAIMALMLPRIMRSEGTVEKQATGSYPALVLSVFSIAKQHRDVLLSAMIQALNFGAFIATWLALALYLTSPEMGYGVDTVGYLAGVSAISVLTTPRLGRWADKVGPKRARLMFALIQAVGVALFYPLSGSAWLLLVPLTLVAAVGPSIDVTGRMTFLALSPEIRTRLTAAYVVIMFIGGGIGSFLGTAVYDAAGWQGTCMLLGAMMAAVIVLCVIARSVSQPRASQ